MVIMINYIKIICMVILMKVEIFCLIHTKLTALRKKVFSLQKLEISVNGT